MLTKIKWRACFTESINFGLISIVSIILIMALAGFVVALYSDGEAMLIAARTLTYPAAPYVVFALIGFAVFNSSRRTPFITLAFNLCTVLFFIGMIFFLSIGVAAYDDVVAMWKEVLIQNFVFSIVVVVGFVVSTVTKEIMFATVKQT